MSYPDICRYEIQTDRSEPVHERLWKKHAAKLEKLEDKRTVAYQQEEKEFQDFRSKFVRENETRKELDERVAQRMHEKEVRIRKANLEQRQHERENEMKAM